MNALEQIHSYEGLKMWLQTTQREPAETQIRTDHIVIFFKFTDGAGLSLRIWQDGHWDWTVGQ